MPGKHAPESPTSFYLSVSRFAGGALVIIGVVVVIALAATGSNKKTPAATNTTKPRTTATVSHGPTASPTASPSPSVRVPSDVTVNVLNGNGRAGLAGRVASTLKDDGYKVKTIDNAAIQSETTIYYRPGHKTDAVAMLRVHPEFKRIAPATSSTPTNAFLTVILGKDFTAT